VINQALNQIVVQFLVTVTRLEAPTTPYILRTGWVIPALLLTAMESELPGKITAQVSDKGGAGCVQDHIFRAWPASCLFRSNLINAQAARATRAKAATYRFGQSAMLETVVLIQYKTRDQDDSEKSRFEIN
jgi:hypothetical protein